LIKHHQLQLFVVLHNYCEMWGAPKLGLTNAKIRNDNLMGFGVNRLPIFWKGKQVKVEGEIFKKVFFFKQWMIDHPIIPWQSNTRWVLKWNPSFYSPNGNPNLSLLSLLVPSNQLPVLPLPYVVLASTRLQTKQSTIIDLVLKARK
jgi:hypothetical protein